MSATINCYFSATHQRGDQLASIGSRSEALKEVELADGRVVINDSVIVAAGTTKLLWVWADTKGFELAKFWLPDAAGSLFVYTRTDPVTSSTDETPSGTGPWNSLPTLSCFDCYTFTNDRAYYAASASVHTGDSGGLPGLASSGSKILGVIGAIAVSNEGTDDVVVSRFITQ